MQWYDKFVKRNSQAETNEKKIRNRSADKKQYQKYREILGKDAPKSLEEFQDMKYNEDGSFERIHAAYQNKRKIISFKEDLRGGIGMIYKPQIPPKLLSLSKKGADGKEIKMILLDGREVSCKFEMLTYANASDDDDSDVMVASVKYDEGYSELLAEEDIKEILD